MEDRIFRLKMLTFLIALLLLGCTDKKTESIRLVAVQGSAYNFSKFIFIETGAEDSLFYSLLPYTGGDIIGFGDYFYFSPDDNLPDTLHINNQDSLVFINENLYGLDLRKISQLNALTVGLSDQNLREIRQISMTIPFSPEEKTFLEHFSAINQKVDLQLANADSSGLFNQNLDWIEKHFKPSLVMMDQIPNDLDFGILQKMKSLRTLSIGGLPHPLEKKPLPALPQLKSLIIGSEKSSPVHVDFYSQNRQLEKLVAWYPVGAEIQQLPKLKELAILDQDLFPPYDFGKYNPNLSYLRLEVRESDDLRQMEKLSNLTWLNLNWSGDSLAFDLGDLVDLQPKLELLHLHHDVPLLNYWALKDFPDLKYLILEDEVFGAEEILDQMTHLNFLSLPDEYFEDSLKVEHLKKSLPKTIISPNSGFCLGSGWLLALLPLAVLMAYFENRYIRKNGQ